VHLAPWTPGSNLAVRVNRAIDDRPGIQQEAICYQWFKQRIILSVSEPSISQRSQIKEDTVKPSVPAREFNLKEHCYNLTQWSGQPGPRTRTRCNQAARTVTLPTAPPRQTQQTTIWTTTTTTILRPFLQDNSGEPAPEQSAVLDFRDVQNYFGFWKKTQDSVQSEFGLVQFKKRGLVWML